MTTCTSEQPKRYSIFQSEKFFLVALSLLTILSAVVICGLLVGVINQLSVLGNGIVSAISNLQQIITVPVFVAIPGSMIALFLFGKLVQIAMKLFQAFWESLEVD